jgi:hypothetical protein
VRFALRSGERVSPSVLTGAGFGVWRRTEAIAEPLTNAAHVLFSGGGLVMPLVRTCACRLTWGCSFSSSETCPTWSCRSGRASAWRF